MRWICSGSTVLIGRGSERVGPDKSGCGQAYRAWPTQAIWFLIQELYRHTITGGVTYSRSVPSSHAVRRLSAGLVMTAPLVSHYHHLFEEPPLILINL